VIGEAIEAMEPFARNRQHAITFERGPEPAWVRGDRARLLQVVSNLLNNAVKFTPRNGRIAVHLRRTGSHVEVGVRDNGPGIAEHRLADIFNLFVQGDQDAARTQGGLGLGLSLVQQLVTLHGGEVSAFSAGVGKGAEFVVCLPAIATPRGDATETPQLLPSRLRHVLVVDDNQDAADTLGALLQGLGFHAQTAYDARGAMAALRDRRPDVAFLDIGLPDMDGATLARNIREEFPDAPPLVALTGYGQKGDRDATRAAGFADHLTKPLGSDALVEALARLFPEDTLVA
jgi:CheY-like chemotaxis protein